jgi:hypothetical protein
MTYQPRHAAAENVDDDILGIFLSDDRHSAADGSDATTFTVGRNVVELAKVRDSDVLVKQALAQAHAQLAAQAGYDYPRKA